MLSTLAASFLREDPFTGPFRCLMSTCPTPNATGFEVEMDECVSFLLPSGSRKWEGELLMVPAQLSAAVGVIQPAGAPTLEVHLVGCGAREYVECLQWLLRMDQYLPGPVPSSAAWITATGPDGWHTVPLARIIDHRILHPGMYQFKGS